MSDDYHRPTLTYPGGAYNATQVRLYGIAPEGNLVYKGNPNESERDSINIKISTTKISNQADIDANFIKKVREYQKSKKWSDEQLFENINNNSIPFPMPIPTYISFQLPIDIKKFGNVVVSSTSSLADENGRTSSCGIIVGYSYEGHCYDLPKPKIMLIPALPRTIPADDCGYDAKAPAGYKLWIVDKLDECVEFEVNQGFVEQLVLEANLPGKRPPNMYAGRHQMGHRSGRLTD